MNCICILAATQGDGTSLCPDSFQEENIVKLCIGLGQAHPEGVLWLLDTEIILTFWSSSKMSATMCLFTVAMDWCNEPIMIHACPPTGAQLRGYVASRGRHPSGAQAQILSGRWSPGLPPVSPRSPGHNSTWPLRTSMMANSGKCWMKSSWKQPGGRGWHPNLGHPWVSGMTLWEELTLAWMMGSDPSRGRGWGPSGPVQ